MLLRGHVVGGCKHFRVRMTEYRDVFTKVTGQELFPGTLNVKIACKIPVKEDFRIEGAEINEPKQDLIFERCRINGIDAFRIRPYHLKTGCGGHGDDTLEIACSQKIPDVEIGTEVKVEPFWERGDSSG